MAVTTCWEDKLWRTTLSLPPLDHMTRYQLEVSKNDKFYYSSEPWTGVDENSITYHLRRGQSLRGRVEVTGGAYSVPSQWINRVLQFLQHLQSLQPHETALPVTPSCSPRFRNEAAPSTHLPSNRLLAGSADTFGNCSYTQFIQVRLKTSQHGIQLTARLGGCGWRRTAPSFSLCHELQVRENKYCKVNPAVLIR